MAKCAAEGAGETILVVEDAEAIRKMVGTILAQSGYRVLEACDGADALETLESSPESVHLVITDVVMPKMNGAELAQRLAVARPELRIMLMSGYADDAIVRSMQTDPAYVFLEKPFTATALTTKVRMALDHPIFRPPAIRTGFEAQ
jgi:two-component system cell cycle sensor histidine kinase/response regulator CckA